MNLFQIVMVSLAAALGLSAFAGPVWVYLKNLLGGFNKKKLALDRLKSPEFVKDEPASPSLVDVVKEWEDLKDVCERAKLNKAVEQLDSMFPLLNSGGKNV